MASLLFLCFIAFAPIASNATTTATVFLTSNQEVIEKGEEIEISFHIKEQKTAAFMATLHFDETKLEWVSGPETIKVEENQVKILWYDKRGRKGSKRRGAW